MFDQVYLSDSPTLNAPGAKQWLLGTFEHDGIVGVGQSYTVSEQFQLSPEVSGRYVIVACNTGAYISDTDTYYAPTYEGPYTNNDTRTVSTRVTALPPADLRVTAVTAPQQNYSGELATVSWTVTNVGADVWSGTADWEDEVYFSPDPTFIESRATLLGTFLHTEDQPLAQGQSYTQTEQVTLPAGIGGTYYIYVRTDQYGTTSTNDGSNADSVAFFTDNGYELATHTLGSTPIPVTYREPDLQVTGLVGPSATPHSGDTINVSWTVTNVGNRDTRQGYWIDRVYLSRSPSLDSSSYMLGQVSHNSILTASGSYQQSLSVRLPDGISGNWYLLVFTDSNLVGSPNQPGVNFEYGVDQVMGRVQEFQGEGNNITAVPLQVLLTPTPDLQVSDVEAPAHVLQGQSFQVTYTVTNNGPGGTPDREPNWQDDVYLSRDQVLDPSDALPCHQLSHRRPCGGRFLHRDGDRPAAGLPDRPLLRIRHHRLARHRVRGGRPPGQLRGHAAAGTDRPAAARRHPRRFGDATSVRQIRRPRPGGLVRQQPRHQPRHWLVDRHRLPLDHSHLELHRPGHRHLPVQRHPQPRRLLRRQHHRPAAGRAAGHLLRHCAHRRLQPGLRRQQPGLQDRGLGNHVPVADRRIARGRGARHHPQQRSGPTLPDRCRPGPDATGVADIVGGVGDQRAVSPLRRRAHRHRLRRHLPGAAAGRPGRDRPRHQRGHLLPTRARRLGAERGDGGHTAGPVVAVRDHRGHARRRRRQQVRDHHYHWGTVLAAGDRQAGAAGLRRVRAGQLPGGRRHQDRRHFRLHWGAGWAVRPGGHQPGRLNGHHALPLPGGAGPAARRDGRHRGPARAVRRRHRHLQPDGAEPDQRGHALRRFRGRRAGDGRHRAPVPRGEPVPAPGAGDEPVRRRLKLVGRLGVDHADGQRQRRDRGGWLRPRPGRPSRGGAGILGADLPRRPAAPGWRGRSGRNGVHLPRPGVGHTADAGRVRRPADAGGVEPAHAHPGRSQRLDRPAYHSSLARPTRRRGRTCTSKG